MIECCEHQKFPRFNSRRLGTNHFRSESTKLTLLIPEIMVKTLISSDHPTLLPECWCVHGCCSTAAAGIQPAAWGGRCAPLLQWLHHQGFSPGLLQSAWGKLVLDGYCYQTVSVYECMCIPCSRRELIWVYLFLSPYLCLFCLALNLWMFLGSIVKVVSEIYKESVVVGECYEKAEWRLTKCIKKE